MNNDLISRSALLNEYRDFKDMDCPSGHTVTADYMIELAEDAPAVDAEVVRHGRWIHDTNNLFGCSECMERDTMSFRRGLKNYCPNCGAKMDGDVDAAD